MEQKNRVIALGFFDGVHIGHGALLTRVGEIAAQKNAAPAAVTFDTHPEHLILEHPVPLLSSPAERADLMRRLYGIRDVIVAPFDEHMMHMPWDRFLTDYLVQTWSAVHLVAGSDFRFGYQGQGTAERLAAKCAALGLGCDIIAPVVYNGILVSSTYIRTLVAQGNMERAAAFLGHPYTLTDTVSHGSRIGSRIGFPTANLCFSPEMIIPAYGVYATMAYLPNGNSYPAITNVGVRPTVSTSGNITVESHLLDYTGNLYGQTVRLEFRHRLRGETRFVSLDALRQAISQDETRTRKYFQSV